MLKLIEYNSGRKCIIIIIMEICKAPEALNKLKALNKHTHIMYIEMENVIKYFFFYISTSVQA